MSGETAANPAQAPPLIQAMAANSSASARTGYSVLDWHDDLFENNPPARRTGAESSEAGVPLRVRLAYRFPSLFGTIFIFLSLYSTQKIDVRRQRIAGAGA
jgi:hypothetical protein